MKYKHCRSHLLSDRFFHCIPSYPLFPTSLTYRPLFPCSFLQFNGFGAKKGFISKRGVQKNSVHHNMGARCCMKYKNESIFEPLNTSNIKQVLCLYGKARNIVWRCSQEKILRFFLRKVLYAVCAGSLMRRQKVFMEAVFSSLCETKTQIF